MKGKIGMPRGFVVGSLVEAAMVGERVRKGCGCSSFEIGVQGAGTRFGVVMDESGRASRKVDRVQVVRWCLGWLRA